MVSGTLLVSAGFAAIAAGLYAYVGLTVGRRKVSKDADLALRLFVAWWLGLAALTLVGGVQTFAAAFGWTDIGLFTALTFAVLGLLCVALWGLLYYLVYLFTGKRAAIWPLTAFYVGYFGLLFYYVQVSHPVAVNVGRWTATVTYEHPPSDLFTSAIIALLILPQFLGALAYFTLYFRVTGRSQKFRIAVVSWSIVFWFGSAGLASAGGLSQTDGWVVLSKFIGLGAALAILAAYRPPRWLKKKLNVTGIEENDSSDQSIDTATHVAPSSRGPSVA